MKSRSLVLVALASLCAPVYGANQTIANGPPGDGTYSASIDDYGSVGDAGFGGGGDSFDPLGVAAAAPTFLSGTFVFVANTHRELLSDNNSFQTGLGVDMTLDGSLSRSVVSANVASDNFDGDSVNDTLTSAFTVTGTGVNLGFARTDTIQDGPVVGSAVRTQTLVITNNDAAGITLRLLHQHDPDLVFGGSLFNDDFVGAAGTSVPGHGPYAAVFQHEAAGMTQGVSLWSPNAHVYNGLLANEPVTGGGGNYPGGGSHTDSWTAFGLPTTPNWVNDVARLGYNTDGISAVAGEAGMSLQWDLAIPAGQSRTLTMLVGYGTLLVPEPSGGLLAVLGFAALAPLLRRRSWRTRS